jgi:hypothetical protein
VFGAKNIPTVRGELSARPAPFGVLTIHALAEPLRFDGGIGRAQAELFHDAMFRAQIIHLAAHEIRGERLLQPRRRNVFEDGSRADRPFAPRRTLSSPRQSVRSESPEISMCVNPASFAPAASDSKVFRSKAVGL